MTTTLSCERCGASVEPGARFCSSCGRDVSAQQSDLATRQVKAPLGGTAQMQEALLEAVRQATLGDYEVLTELGRGGMATVYLAHDLSLDRKVAIKVMSPTVLGTAGMVERFKLEARTAAQLSHPHIIPIYAVRETEHLVYFVMKFVAGRPLDSIIKEIGPLPIAMVQDILIKVSEALGYAHRRGVVHRDVKPGNIMIDDEGSPMVTDFGIAKVAEKQGLTMTGAAIGTPSYMSPEQCAAKKVTGASDQYSLGIVSYEMLTGRLPFDADSIIGIMYKHFNEEPPSLLEARPDCPPALADVVTRMLAKAPEARWPNFEDMLAALGGSALPYDSPIRSQMIDLAKAGASVAALRRVSTPHSPIPAAATDATVRMSSGQVSKATSKGATPPGPTATRKPPTATARPAPTTAPPAAEPVRKSATVPLAIGGAVLALAAGVTVWLAPWRSDAPVPTAPAASATAPQAELAVLPSRSSLPTGGSLQLSVTGTDGAAWSSGNPGVATVSPNGTVTAVAPGSATITAADGARRATAEITVAATAPATPSPAPAPAPASRAPVASVVVSGAPSRMTVGETARLIALARDARGGTLGDRPTSWVSGAPAIVRVTQDGVAMGVAPGTAIVTASIEGRSQSATIVVEQEPVGAVVIASLTEPLVVGSTAQLSAGVRSVSGASLSGRAVSWSSSNSGVATVGADGTVRAVGPGSASITATSEGRSASTVVSVNPAAVAAARPAPPPAAERADPRQGVEELVQAYARAIESRDIAQIRRLYPNITSDQEQGLRSAFESMRGLRVTLGISELQLEGDVARATLNGAYEFYNTSKRRDERQPVTFRAVMERRDGGWRITSTR